ncbi:MAG: hypothetical protein ACXADY_24560 [Candidatus Hodarchaeales archaeon]
MLKPRNPLLSFAYFILAFVGITTDIWLFYCNILQIRVIFLGLHALRLFIIPIGDYN